MPNIVKVLYNKLEILYNIFKWCQIFAEELFSSSLKWSSNKGKGIGQGGNIKRNKYQNYKYNGKTGSRRLHKTKLNTKIQLQWQKPS